MIYSRVITHGKQKSHFIYNFWQLCINMQAKKMSKGSLQSTALPTGCRLDHVRVVLQEGHVVHLDE